MRTAMRTGRWSRGVGSALTVVICLSSSGIGARADEPARETGSFSLLTGAGEAGPPAGSTPSDTNAAVNPTHSNAADATPSVAKGAAVGVNDSDTIRRAPKRSAGKSGATGGSPAGARDLFKMLQPAGLVLLAIGVLTFVAKRWLPQARQAAGGGAAIQVLARQHLSGKQSLCLVRLGRGLVLVGVTPDRISTVAQIQDPDEVAEVVTRIEQTRGRSFTQTMTRFSSRTAEPVDAAEDADDAEPIVRGGGLDSSQERIREMVRRVRAMAEAGPDGGQRGSRRESA